MQDSPTLDRGENEEEKTSPTVKPKYSVFVDDNFHYMDASERYLLGEFETQVEAIQAAKSIVDVFLTRGYMEGMPAEKLYQHYVAFGDDPFIISAHHEDTPFNAWDYAKSRCDELCNLET